MSVHLFRRPMRSILLTSAALVAFGNIALPLIPMDFTTGAVFAADMLGPDGSFAPIVAQNKPAVVTVMVSVSAPAQQMNGQPNGQTPFGNGQTPFDQFFRQFFGPNGPGGQASPGNPQPQLPNPPAQKMAGLGSGFIIQSDGTIVTNNHVVKDADKITVKLDDGREFPATVVGTDERTDIAVIRIKADGPLPTVNWGDSDKLELGDRVIAIGNPFGIGTTVTSGIVSARGRDLHNGPYDDFIQVDAAINHGNSGGALIGTDGNVVGITAAIFSPNDGNVGVGFAIPSDQAKTIVDGLLSNGSIERGYLGVRIQPVTQDIAAALNLKDAAGALVSEVLPDSPALAGGIQTGDVVLAVNGTAVSDPKNLSLTMASAKPGSVETMTIWRNGAKLDVKVTLVSLPAENQMAQSEPTPQQPGDQSKDVPELGLSLAAITPDLRTQFGLADDATGLVVTKIDDARKAGEQGLSVGDLIQSVNTLPVATVEDVTKALDDAKAQNRSTVLVMVEHQGQHAFTTLPLANS